MKRVLAVVAHADDEVLGCGGALARHVDEGDDVMVFYMTCDRSSRENAIDGATAAQEMHGALSILGVQHHVVQGFPDQRLDTVGTLTLAQAIEVERDRWLPEIVYTHHPLDQNTDHSAVYRACSAAFRPWRASCVKELRLFEIPPLLPFAPDLYIAIDDERKCRALEAYKSELRDWPDPRSSIAISVMAAARGIGISRACEAFAVQRLIR